MDSAAAGAASEDERDGRSYLVAEQPQLDAASFLRIPIALVTMVGTLGGLLFAMLYVVRLFTNAAIPQLVLFITVIVSFFVALRITIRVSRLVRSAPRMLLALSSEAVRYRRRGEDERRFENRGLTLEKRTPSRLRVRSGDEVHELPVGVVPQGDGAAEFLRLGFVDGKVIIARVILTDGDAREDILPYA